MVCGGLLAIPGASVGCSQCFDDPVEVDQRVVELLFGI